MKVTVSRRHMLAAAVTTTPIAALAANAAHTPRLAAADPVFVAIERHRQAIQARLAEHDDDTGMQLLAAETDAFLAWLTTPRTTLAGVIATLNHASRRSDEDGNGDHVYTHLAEAAQYIGSDVLAAGERFPAMIAATLRQIATEKLL